MSHFQHVAGRGGVALIGAGQVAGVEDERAVQIDAEHQRQIVGVLAPTAVPVRPFHLNGGLIVAQLVAPRKGRNGNAALPGQRQNGQRALVQPLLLRVPRHIDLANLNARVQNFA